jgi:hypothetical protein
MTLSTTIKILKLRTTTLSVTVKNMTLSTIKLSIITLGITALRITITIKMGQTSHKTQLSSI